MTMSIKQRKIKIEPRIKLNCDIYKFNLAVKQLKRQSYLLVNKLTDDRVHRKRKGKQISALKLSLQRMNKM